MTPEVDKLSDKEFSKVIRGRPPTRSDFDFYLQHYNLVTCLGYQYIQLDMFQFIQRASGR